MSPQVEEILRSALVAAARRPSVLDDLPFEAQLKRVMDRKKTAAFLDISVVELRRRERAGSMPPMTMLGARKGGYQLGSIIKLIDAATA